LLIFLNLSIDTNFLENKKHLKNIKKQNILGKKRLMGIL